MLIHKKVQAIFESCVEYALFPINTYPKKYTQQKICKKIEKLFNLPTSDVIAKLQPLAGYQVCLIPTHIYNRVYLQLVRPFNCVWRLN